ncbi:restriction endonuclease subunit S [Campylobacter upsaliensis]|nr:restriction endonuclease subunit S [Campylobacter upsaliensis]
MKKHTQSPYESSKVSYKPSGIEWLGEIPQSWKNVSIRSCFTESNQRCNTDSYPLLSVTIANGIIYQDDIENKKDISNDDKSNYKIVPLNAVAYNKMRMWQGAVGVNTLTTGIVSPAYIVAIPNEKILPNFVSYLFKSKIMISEFDKNSYGLCLDMNNLRYDDFRNIKIPLPPLQEQKEIAEFLDKKCEKIQNYINKKQKLITLLQEKKQALINEAVCGRVACHTERSEVSTTAYKPSGIEYLGLIPHHWEVARSGLIYKNISSGTTPQSDNDEYYKNGNIFWINSGDLNDSVLTNSKNKITQKAMMAYSALKISPKGSLIIAMYGATIGKVSILGIDACTNQACCVLCESKYLNTRFVFYYFIAKRQDLISMAYGGGQPNISQDIIKNFKIPLPLLQEQKQIANFLDEKCEKINSVIEKTKKQIELIKEYKNTLINEAVCGRIRLN